MPETKPLLSEAQEKELRMQYCTGDVIDIRLVHRAMNTISALRERVRELEDRLKPFADTGNWFDPMDDGKYIYFDFEQKPWILPIAALNPEKDPDIAAELFAAPKEPTNG